MRADDLVSLLSILFNKHHVPPGRCAEVTGVVVRITRPREAVIRHLVPLFACDLAGFAADAHSWISKETDLDIFLHVIVPALVRALCAFADHKGTRASSLRRRLDASETHALLLCAVILFLPSRGRRRLCLRRQAVLRDAK